MIDLETRQRGLMAPLADQDAYRVPLVEQPVHQVRAEVARGARDQDQPFPSRFPHSQSFSINFGPLACLARGRPFTFPSNTTRDTRSKDVG